MSVTEMRSAPKQRHIVLGSLEKRICMRMDTGQRVDWRPNSASGKRHTQPAVL